jgi:electron transfer flavoprotein beta subunit
MESQVVPEGFSMKIIVVIKRVPDTETQVRLGPDGKTIDPTGVVYVMNPYDEYAVEEAVQLKEKHGGEITVICVGPEEATKEIRTAIAMGCDDGVLIKTAEVTLDPMVVARTLAEEIKGREYDLLLFGKKNVDDDYGQIPLFIAAKLDLPVVTAINELEVNPEESKATVRRNIEGGAEVFETSLPAVFTAEKGLNEPRYPNLIAVRKSMKAPLDIKDLPAVEAGLKVLSMELPPPREGGKIVGEGVEAVGELVKLLQDEAKVV